MMTIDIVTSVFEIYLISSLIIVSLIIIVYKSNWRNFRNSNQVTKFSNNARLYLLNLGIVISSLIIPIFEITSYNYSEGGSDLGNQYHTSLSLEETFRLSWIETLTFETPFQNVSILIVTSSVVIIFQLYITYAYLKHKSSVILIIGSQLLYSILVLSTDLILINSGNVEISTEHIQRIDYWETSYTVWDFDGIWGNYALLGMIMLLLVEMYYVIKSAFLQSVDSRLYPDNS